MTIERQKEIISQARENNPDKVIELAEEYYSELNAAYDTETYNGDIEDVTAIMTAMTDEGAFRLYFNLDTICRDCLIDWCGGAL